MTTETDGATETPPADLGYGAALAELESIVAGMEQGQVDVDHLTSRIKRASVLVRYCRDRLDTVQRQVEEMTAATDDVE